MQDNYIVLGLGMTEQLYWEKKNKDHGAEAGEK